MGIGILLGLVHGRSTVYENEVEFISVGQGDCTLVKSQGRAMLIDVGPKKDGVDSGSIIIVPTLRNEGIRSIDYILLSHPDLDHIGGLGVLHRAYPEAKIVVPASFENDAKMLDGLDRGSVDPKTVEWANSESGVLGVFKFYLKCPIWDPSTDDNMGSMFVHFTDGSATFTTSGDAPSSTEMQMMPLADWKADILHLGHHGSKFSSCQPWLDYIHPKIAIVSCGLNNEYHHPHQSTLKRVAKEGAKVYRTDLQGTLIFADINHHFQFEQN